MRRRQGSFNIHALLIGIAAIVLLSGAAKLFLTGAAVPGGKIRLSFWNGFTGPDGIVMLRMIEDFNRKNPDVQVVMQRIPWATYYNKLTVAGTDGRGPEIFVSHADALPRIRRAGFVAKIPEAYSGPGAIDSSDLDEEVYKEVVFDGVAEGVPLDIHPQGMYCNKEMLVKAGYVDAAGNPRAPRTGKEFFDLMAKTTIEANPSLPEKQWGFALTAWGNNFRTILPQFGGDYLDAKGDSVINSPENVKALEVIEKLAKEKKVPPPDNGLGWFGFRTKRVAMVWDGVYMLGDLLRLNDFEYIGAPIPRIGPQDGALANSHILCVKASLKGKEKEAAIRFIKYLSDHSIEWAAAGQVPARKSVRASAEFSKMQVQSAFAKEVPTMKYPPRTPTIFEFMLEVDRAVEKVVRGQASSKTALDEAQKKIQEIIERDRREHPSEVKP